MTVPTRSGGAERATQAKTPPVPMPRKNASTMKLAPAASSGGGCRVTTTAITADPASEIITTIFGWSRSDRIPPIGRAMTAAMANPAVRAPASVTEKS